MITIQDQPTDRTFMYSLREFLLGSVTTPGTILTRVRRINQNTRPTSFLRFVGRILSNLTPRSIRDALGKTVILHHVGWRQILKYNYAVFINQMTTKFVCKIIPTVFNSLMDPSDSLSTKPTFWRSFLSFAKSTLNLSQSFFFLTKESRVLNLLTSVVRDEAFEPKVKTHGAGDLRKSFVFGFDRETNEPLVCRRSLDRRGLDGAFYGSMEVQPDVTYFPDLQNRTFKKTSTRILRKTNGVVPKLTSKPGVTSLFFFGLNPTEETLERKVYSVLDVLKDLTVDFLEPRIFVFPPCEQKVSIVETNRSLVLFPGVLPNLQGFVVNIPTGIQPVVQRGTLGLGRVESVLESFTQHPTRE